VGGQTLKCKILILIILILLSLTNLSISSDHLDESVIKNIYRSIKYLNSDIDDTITSQISLRILYNSKKHNIPWYMIVSIINIESEFNKKAKNNKCYGLMQINISAHKDKLKKLKLQTRDLFYIKHNIDLGCIILKEHINNTKNLNKALKRYSGNDSKYVKKINQTISKISHYIKSGTKKYANVDGKS